MALLPDDPRDQYRFLAIVALLAAGLLFYLYVYKPRRSDLATLTQRVEEIESQNALAETRSENLEALRRELELGQRRFAVLERLVPERSEVPAIYEAVASESQSLGLDLINVVPADPQPDSTGFFMRQLWEMEVQGGYHDVGEFLTRVASFDRIVRPEIREIQAAEETNSGRQLVGVKFDLETYVLALGRSAGGGER
ncbi:MAG: type 4a pilus biogenesis protein PilO [Gemmatimonadota bacterium]